MGRRSRQRGGPHESAPPPAPVAPAPPRTPRRRAERDEAPQAPWHPVPLVELAVLVGIVAMVVGFLSEGDRREILVGAGVGLASLAGLELALREHFAGYRSHSSLLAGAAALLTGVPVAYFADDRLIGLLVGVALGVASFFALRATFARRSGGLAWRA